MTNANGRAHFIVKAKEAAKWKNLVVLSVGVSRRPPEPLKKAKLVLTRFSSVAPDFDGLVSGFKHIIDGLVLAKVIRDDKVITVGQPKYNWEQVGPGQGKIRVEVVEVEE